MRSTNLAFDLDYMQDMDDQLFSLLTNDYELRCSNYAVAYNFVRFLETLKMCEHSSIIDDCYYPFSSNQCPYEWVVFFTCRPKDALRMKYVARHIPSSIRANVRILDENEEEI